MSDVKIQKDSITIKKKVREHYASAILDKNMPSSGGCCSESSNHSCCNKSAQLYDDPAVFELPAEVTDISFGCGDPVTLASLQPGQTVLDLGSGGGIDCFLAAKKVGPEGHVIGVDMTPEMIERARENKTRLKADHVEFRLGEIEHLPVADQSIDVVISNCVINLSVDKQQVLNEVYRVLKPGGKLAVSDIVTQESLPEILMEDLTAWAGCISGALDVNEYVSIIEKAGFSKVEVRPVYFDDDMVKEAEKSLDKEKFAGLSRETIKKMIFSAKITAFKPVS